MNFFVTLIIDMINITQEKWVKDGESMKGLQTLFQVGIHRSAENSSKLIEGYWMRLLLMPCTLLRIKKFQNTIQKLLRFLVKTVIDQNGHKPK